MKLKPIDPKNLSTGDIVYGVSDSLYSHNGFKVHDISRFDTTLQDRAVYKLWLIPTYGKKDMFTSLVVVDVKTSEMMFGDIKKYQQGRRRFN